MSLNRKKEILRAMRIILREYKNDEHTTSTTDCELCKLFLHKGESICSLCPMFAFVHENDNNTYSCMNRKCEPVDCSRSYTDNEYNAVIKFYEKAIKKIEKMSNDDLKKESAFEFLIAIDNKVAEKYDL
jgi:hypothetical protein